MAKYGFPEEIGPRKIGTPSLTVRLHSSRQDRPATAAQALGRSVRHMAALIAAGPRNAQRRAADTRVGVRRGPVARVGLIGRGRYSQLENQLIY